MDKQLSFWDIEQSNFRRTTRKADFLSRMEEVIPWFELESLIRPYYFKNQRGRPARNLQEILRMYLLQIWYGLSDEETVESIYEIRSFSNFCGIDFAKSYEVAHSTTLLHFRHLLEKHNLGLEILNLINAVLESKGMMCRGGAIVDATIIASAKSIDNRDKSRDPEMSSTCKNKQWYFGMKEHIRVDPVSGFVQDAIATTAKEHDITVADKLIRDSDEVFYGDAGYIGIEERVTEEVRQRVKFKITHRRKTVKKLAKIQQRIILESDRCISRVRVKVEHIFHVVKNIFNTTKALYRGLAKNHNMFLVKFAMANIYLAEQGDRFSKIKRL
jgi:IS5 family transposase